MATGCLAMSAGDDNVGQLNTEFWLGNDSIHRLTTELSMSGAGGLERS